MARKGHYAGLRKQGRHCQYSDCRTCEPFQTIHLQPPERVTSRDARDYNSARKHEYNSLIRTEQSDLPITYLFSFLLTFAEAALRSSRFLAWSLCKRWRTRLSEPGDNLSPMGPPSREKESLTQELNATGPRHRVMSSPGRLSISCRSTILSGRSWTIRLRLRWISIPG